MVNGKWFKEIDYWKLVNGKWFNEFNIQMPSAFPAC
jgi:hypothetical protein